MAPKLLHFIHKLFRISWKRQVDYGQTLSRCRRNNCVLKSVSSKSSLSASSCSLATPPRHACSMDSINFEFRTPTVDKPDLCCVRKCCEKCFCEEGEAIAQDVRKKCRRKARAKACLKKDEPSDRKSRCDCSRSNSAGSLDSACDVTSTSSCEDADCRFREGCGSQDGVQGGIPVQAFAHIHAAACTGSDYETLTPTYENVPDTGEDIKEEPPYDFVPTRPPRAITEPRYENVLSVNCVDACVFRQISSIVDSTKSPAQVVESLQQLHKNYSCVRRTSSADNEINYYFENYDELENDLNMELERRLSD